jgi:hypothetical protein
MPATLIPLEEYLRYSGEYEPDADYVDSELELRLMGQYDHATWQQAIQQWFIEHHRQ